MAKSNILRLKSYLILILALLWQIPTAKAQTFELSLLAGFSKTSYGEGTYTKSSRFTGSLAVNITSLTQIELGYTDSRSRYVSNSATSSSTTQTWDRNLSLAIVQSLLPKSFIVQPFIKGGAAQLYRIQKLTYDGVAQPESVLKQPSGVLGAGLRIFLHRNISLKCELTTYLPNFHISAAKDNYDWEAGLSFHL